MAAINAPSWFSDKTVTVSTAPTCGLTKGGRLLRLIDDTGRAVTETDPETGETRDAINDLLLRDALALRNGERTDTLRDIPASEIQPRTRVPVYYDRRYHEAFSEEMKKERFNSFSAATLGDLSSQGVITILSGHGSPSSELRIGDVPYIKVSDLRAGLVNINPTNRVPRSIAETFWKGPTSGLKPFDLLSPERTSKNIGDFCVLMPGQEQLLLTKEIIVLRPGPNANFDAFYLLWAMTLKIVREQWKRVVFMQTNREDVGKRYLEIEIPVPSDAQLATRVSERFRSYFTTIATARATLSEYLAQTQDHHFFVSGAEPAEEEPTAAALGE